MHGFGRLEVHLTRLDWMGYWRSSRHIFSSNQNYHTRNLFLLPIFIKPSSRLCGRTDTICLYVPSSQHLGVEEGSKIWKPFISESYNEIE